MPPFKTMATPSVGSVANISASASDAAACARVSRAFNTRMASLTVHSLPPSLRRATSFGGESRAALASMTAFLYDWYCLLDVSAALAGVSKPSFVCAALEPKRCAALEPPATALEPPATALEPPTMALEPPAPARRAAGVCCFDEPNPTYSSSPSAASLNIFNALICGTDDFVSSCVPASRARSAALRSLRVVLRVTDFAPPLSPRIQSLSIPNSPWKEIPGFSLSVLRMALRKPTSTSLSWISLLSLARESAHPRNLRIVGRYWFDPVSARACARPDLMCSNTGPQSITVSCAGLPPIPVYDQRACTASAFISKSSGCLAIASRIADGKMRKRTCFLSRDIVD